MTDDVTPGCILKINKCKAPTVMLEMCLIHKLDWKVTEKDKRTGTKTKKKKKRITKEIN